MNYQVIFSDIQYFNFTEFDYWYNTFDITSSFHVWFDIKFQQKHQYIKQISTDMKLEQVTKLPHDHIMIDNDEYGQRRYRIFTFHSQEHFTFFLLSISK